MAKDALVPEGTTVGAQVSEGAIIKDLHPIMIEAVQKFEKSLQVFDSQEKKWLRNGPLTNYLTPDFEVSHEAFSVLVHGLAEVPINLVHELSRSIRSIIEGKKNKALTNEALGQVVSYIQKLLSLRIDVEGLNCTPLFNVRMLFSWKR